jgi:hypothetical protein
MLEHLYGADSSQVPETQTASDLWAADDAFASAPPSHSERAARAFLIAKHGDTSKAYNTWQSAMTGRGHELRELFAEVAAWKSGR